VRLLVPVVLFFVVSVAAAEPPFDPDSLERELVTCLMAKPKPTKCAQTVLARSVLPGNEKLTAVAVQIDEVLKDWLGEQTVYQVHPVSADKRGSIYEKRIYLIEDDSAALMMLSVTLFKQLGEWYVWKFQVSSTRETIESLLLGPGGGRD
jgi:hypothetical protein